MGKKIWYSEPLATQWEIYHKNHKENETDEQFFKRAITPSHLQDWQKNQLGTFLWSLWYSDATKKMLHLYFIDSGLRKFLEEIPLIDLDGIKQYINDNGFFSKQGILELSYFPYCIHVPYENKYKGFAFGLMNDADGHLVLNWAVEKGGAWCSEKNYKELQKVDTDEARYITKIFRYAINTIAYMEAHPECIKDGVPDTILENRSENSFVVEISEKVIESVENSKNGKKVKSHWRKGHYRRLNSDYFTHKKGQIIFVHETMVNGIAKTVYTSDEINLENYK